MKIGLLLASMLALSSALSGCVSLSDPNASQDYTADAVATLDAQTRLGQSFISRRPNLDGITLWLTRLTGTTGGSTSTSDNVLAIKLYRAPGDSVPVYASSIVIPASGSNFPIAISLPPQRNPAGQAYYLLLANDSGTIQVNGRNGNAIAAGQAYLNDQPVDADIAFRLSYDYGLLSFLGDLRASLGSFWLAGPLLVLLWLPGWLLLEFSGLRLRYDFGEQTALAVGLSLALVPVLMLWTSILKLSWTAQALYFAGGFLTALFIARLVYRALVSPRQRQVGEDSITTNSSGPAENHSRTAPYHFLALVVIFLAALAVRLVMVRDLATPAWVDSVHHALITRLIMQSGGYPASYQPYMDFATSSYHAGFHSLAAAFTWLSRLDLAQSLLTLGQVLNALSVFAVYLFTKTLTRSATAGLVGAMVTGFITPMPAYYTSWGRYTELAGLLLLPALLALMRPWFDGSGGRKWPQAILLGALAGGGLFMIHYRVLAFLACLVAAYAIVNLTRRKDSTSARPARLVARVLGMAVLAILLVLPWFIQAARTNLLPSITSPSTASVAVFSDFAWPYLTTALGTQALVVAALGLLWGLLHAKRFTFIIIFWVLLLFTLANLAAFKLPLGGLISNASVEIMLFMPISILAGYFIAELLTQWHSLTPTRLALPSLAVVAALLGLAGYLGAIQLIPILNPVTILSRAGDLPAMQWIRENIPAGETVVINPFSWGYGLYAGNDGGYWIAPLTGHPTLPPPVLYGLGPNATQESQLSQQVVALASDPAGLWQFLHTHQLNYVYLGVRGGVLSPEKLASSGLFDLRYHQQGVWIFSLKP